MKKKPVAVLCSDIHLSHNPPIARSAEPDWYAAMARPLREIARIAAEQGGETPVIVAGDIFDKWHSPAQLISFAIDEFKKFPGKVYAIPGQHDLPDHRYDEMHRSAYGTLTRSGAVIDVPGHETAWIDPGVTINSFPWGFDIQPPRTDGYDSFIQLAVVHEYVWKDGYSYPGADTNKKVPQTLQRLEGYDAAVFGDNHKGFYSGKILNCGTMMRRKTDEIGYKPHIGILYDDASIEVKYLSTSEDVFIDRPEFLELDEELLDFTEYIEEMKDMGVNSLDYREEINLAMIRLKTSPPVKDLVLNSLGTK